MTMTVYRSTDAGAPPLRGYTPGDVINILNLCLVTGYGSKPGSGWTMPFTGTNVAAFKQGAGSNGMYLRVDDTDARTNNTRATLFVGYENMTDVNTGTPSSFPTVAQASEGVTLCTYGNDTAANSRPWILYADSKRFYFFIKNNSTYTFTNTRSNTSAVLFGDPIGFQGDSFNTFLRGNTTRSYDYGYNLANYVYSGGTYVARNLTGLGGGIVSGLAPNSNFANGSGGRFDQGPLVYPNPADGALYLSTISLYDTSNGIRGRLPGIWASCVPIYNYLTLGAIFNGTGDLAGRTFEYMTESSSGALIEISDTWET